MKLVNFFLLLIIFTNTLCLVHLRTNAALGPDAREKMVAVTDTVQGDPKLLDTFLP